MKLNTGSWIRKCGYRNYANALSTLTWSAFFMLSIPAISTAKPFGQARGSSQASGDSESTQPVQDGQAKQTQNSNLVPARDPVPPPQPPKIAEASKESELALRALRLPDGVTAKLFAAEPDVANPVAIEVDVDGRVLVCESFRQERGVEDNRNHPEWLVDDLSSRSVADRLTYMKKHLGEKILEYSAQDDRIRILEDTDGDGTADRSEVFASGFNRPEDGTGAGVLSFGKQIWYTCIPNLWLFEKNQSGEYEKSIVHSGFGVRFAFRGHDLHGLTVGPDGRLYFSIGDRGYNLGDGLINLESGAVFRCEMDGSDLEVFAIGLRNPQELAFDNHGNLFTGDNNSDSGIDQARFVYLVEGGDSGWRMQYQYMSDRGPFVRDEIWNPRSEKAPAYIVPAIETIGDGPAGLTFYPGTGWSDDFTDCFFLCDFRGQANLSGVRTIKVTPLGASFEVTQDKEEIWNVLATDIDFGPDSRLFVSDWVESWDGVGKGRVYALTHEDSGDSPAVAEVATLLQSGLSTKPNKELGSLLGHPDQRIRLEAQFEMVRRKLFAELVQLAANQESDLTQLHAVWGIGHLLRLGFQPNPLQYAQWDGVLNDLVTSSFTHVRSNAYKLIGDSLRVDLADRLVAGLSDKSHHVQFHAMMSIGKVGTADQLPAVVDFLASSKVAEDKMLRHSGIMALTGITKRYIATRTAETDLAEFQKSHPFRSTAGHRATNVRLATVVAMRKLQQGLLLGMIDDPHPKVAEEMARLLYDRPNRTTYQPLAVQLDNTKRKSAPLLRRALHANFLLGQAENSSRLAFFAGNNNNDLQLRLEAIQLLEGWREPGLRDAINGRVRRTGKRSTLAVRVALPNLWQQVRDQPEALQHAVLKAARKIRVSAMTSTFAEIVSEREFSVRVREAALLALGDLEANETKELVARIVGGNDESLKTVAVRVLSKSSPDMALDYLRTSITSDLTEVRQESFRTLADMSDAGSLELIRESLLRVSSFPADTRLDVYVAAESRRDELDPADFENASKLLAVFPNGKYEMTLSGGDANRGAGIFKRTELSCVRCHAINTVGGKIGPDLGGIGTKKDRAYILRSITKPNAEIAEGFGSVLILDVDGRTHVGIIKTREAGFLELMDDQGKTTRINEDDIDDMKETKSAMAEDLVQKLSLGELRDLIEYVSGLK